MINRAHLHDTPDRDTEHEPITLADIAKMTTLFAALAASTVAGCVDQSRNARKTDAQAAPHLYQPGPEIFSGNAFMPSVGQQ